MTDVNVVKQFYSHTLEQGSIGAFPGRHRDSAGITHSLTVATSAMVGMDRDETVSSRVFTGLASALTVKIRCYIGY
jgi:hypothetical protein